MNLIKSNKTRLIILSLLASFIVLIISANIKRMSYHCFNANDFSIYQQGIYDIAYSDSWNPILKVKDSAIFNDHFDMAVLLAALFVKITVPTATSLLIFEWLWFVALVFCSYFLLLRRKLISGPLDKKFLFSLLLIIFSRSLLQGLEFPVHPTTWSMLPVFLLFYFVIVGNRIGIVIAALVATQFREIIPFSVVGLSLFYFIKKDYKLALGLFLVGAVTIFNLIILRPFLIGPSVQYSEGAIKEMLHGHVFFIWDRLIHTLPNFHFKVFLQFLLPVLLLIKFEIKSFRSLLKHPLFSALLFILPNFGVHFITGRPIVHHHSIPMVVPIITVLIFSSLPTILLEAKKKWYLIVVSLIFIGIGSSRYTRMFNSLFRDKDGKCEISNAKRESTDLFKIVIKEIKNREIVLASGGVISRLVRPGNNIYQMCDSTKIMDKYDYLILEKGYTGDINPMTAVELDTIRERCRRFTTNVLFEDSYYSVFKGNFTDECLQLKKKWPGRSKFVPPKQKVNDV